MKRKLALVLLLFFVQLSHANPEQAPLSVWVNEAIVATYSYDYKNFLNDQKKIAKYFTVDAWIAYSQALNSSKIPNSVQKNLYYVSSVATESPVITSLGSNHWKATMKLLVDYKNPQYQQQQNLKVTIDFMSAPSGQGVRGYSITNFQSVPISPPCTCCIEEKSPSNSPPTTTPNNAK
jgi:hypothetical protein